MDGAGQPPQEVVHSVQHQPLQVCQHSDVSFSIRVQTAVHLVEHRGLASAALTKDDDNVVLMLPNQAGANLFKDIIAAIEHRLVLDGGASNVWVGEDMRLTVHTAPSLSRNYFNIASTPWPGR